MSLYQDELAGQFNALISYPNWLVAYSGGVDSTVLLAACQQFIKSLTDVQLAGQTVPSLNAIHVDHQLSPNHTHWAEHCRQFCLQREIPLHVVCVDVKNQKGGIEQAAREQRYQAFEQHLQTYRNDTALLLAQHVDDQAETILLRLFRGSGIRGVAAMAHERRLGNTVLVRPFLNLSKQQLLDYANSHSLTWIEDESNENIRFDRNYLRLGILPVLKKRWPRVVEALARFGEYANEAERLNTDLAELDFCQLISREQQFGECLQLPRLLELPAYRRRNLYRYWMSKHTHKLGDTKKLHALDDWLQTCPVDGEQMISGYSFRVYRQQLFLLSLQWLDSLSSFLVNSKSWQLPECIHFEGVGELRTQTKDKTGLAVGRYKLARRNRNQLVTVNGLSKTVHKIMQEQEIPTWLRDYYPVVYRGNDVAAIGALVADNFCVPQGHQLTFQFTPR